MASFATLVTSSIKVLPTPKLTFLGFTVASSLRVRLRGGLRLRSIGLAVFLHIFLASTSSG